MPKSWRLFLQRLNIAFRYYWQPLKQIWIWLRESNETSNFLYAITPISESYMISAVANVSGKSYYEIEYYFHELKCDQNLREHIKRHARAEDRALHVTPEKLYARRLNWYAFVRAMKPKMIVEAGIAKGLGACVLTAALAKNGEEGYEGRYYGTDIDPNAGYLLGKGMYSQLGEILYGDTIQSLMDFQNVIDLFINDDDHSYDYEGKEYEVVFQKLSREAVILGDNAHITNCLLNFAKATGRQFLFVSEKPAKHWYPGAGVGIAFKRQSQWCDIFDIQLECLTENYGSGSESWILCPDGLTGESIVYSIGVGEDINFDLSVIERHGVTVYAFDPTSRSVEWVKKQALPDQFHFIEVAVSDVEATAAFYPPANTAHVSHSLLNVMGGTNEPVYVQTKRLSMLMHELGHTHIDVLKMDIEGAEYAVIADFLQANLDVRQFLVEFHHRFSDIGIEKTKNAIVLLRNHGYKLFAISRDGLNYSFKKECLS
jgi:FkbM family methyltransferase